MTDKTGIEWTDVTWNPVTGCTKVSAGCKHCYAEREWPRLSGNPKTVYYGREFTDVRCHPERLELPLRWKKPSRVFVNSMSDLFHEAVPNEFIDQVFAVMALAPQHTFQVLTKRAERMHRYLTDAHIGDRIWGATLTIAKDRVCPESDPGWPIKNVWLGISIENQSAADRRIPLLLKTPAAVRWVSAEPLLQCVDLQLINCGGLPDREIDWVVVGGESGSAARPMHPDWVRDIRDQCQFAKVPFLFKQWGEWAPTVPVVNEITRQIEQRDLGGMVRIGKKSAGRHLDGKIYDEYPIAIGGWR